MQKNHLKLKTLTVLQTDPAAWGPLCHCLSYLGISHMPVYHVVETGKYETQQNGLISPNLVDGNGSASPSSPVQHSGSQQYTNSATNKLCTDNNTSRDKVRTSHQGSLEKNKKQGTRCTTLYGQFKAEYQKSHNPNNVLK